MSIRVGWAETARRRGPDNLRAIPPGRIPGARQRGIPGRRASQRVSQRVSQRASRVIPGHASNADQLTLAPPGQRLHRPIRLRRRSSRAIPGRSIHLSRINGPRVRRRRAPGRQRRSHRKTQTPGRGTHRRLVRHREPHSRVATSGRWTNGPRLRIKRASLRTYAQSSLREVAGFASRRDMCCYQRDWHT